MLFKADSALRVYLRRCTEFFLHRCDLEIGLVPEDGEDNGFECVANLYTIEEPLELRRRAVCGTQVCLKTMVRYSSADHRATLE